MVAYRISLPNTHSDDSPGTICCTRCLASCTEIASFPAQTTEKSVRLQTHPPGIELSSIQYWRRPS